MAITWSRVQGKLDTAGSGTTRNVAFTSPVTSGNIVVGGILTGQSNQLVSGVTDDKGNAYVLVNSSYNPGDGSGLTVTGFRSQGPLTNAPQTLTFTFAASTTLVWIIQEEFHPSSAITGLCLDGSQTMTTNSSADGILTTQPFTTLKSDTLLFNAAFFTGTGTTGAGWTAGQGSGSQQMSQWQLAASPNSSNVATWATNTQKVWTTVFGVNGTARTSWELRQNNMQRAATNTTTGTLVFPNTVASGNIVVGGIAVGTNGNVSDITSIVDDKGNNYTILPNYINNKGRAIFWSGGPLTNAPKTLTCTTSVTETVIYFLANEFIVPTGISSVQLDGTPAYTSVGTDPNYSSPSLTTTANGSLIYTFADVSGFMEPSNGFWSLNADRMSWSDAYIVQPSAGAITANWKNVGGAGGPNVLAIAGFAATSSSGGGGSQTVTAVRPGGMAGGKAWEVWAAEQKERRKQARRALGLPDEDDEEEDDALTRFLKDQQSREVRLGSKTYRKAWWE